jgi:hypothetical protein
MAGYVLGGDAKPITLIPRRTAVLAHLVTPDRRKIRAH